jgi:NAD+ synthase
MFGGLSFYLAQINPIVGNLPHNLGLIRAAWDEAPNDCSLVVFPELALTGYIPEDLLDKPSFLDSVHAAIKTLVEESKNHSAGILVGTPWRSENDNLYNAALLIRGGEILAHRYKHELPNYGVFDEKRYFTAGPLPEPVEFNGVTLGVMICEDMWFGEVAAHLERAGAEALVVINGSPYTLGKHEKRRVPEARRRVQETNLPLLYVNQVGGQDDLVFDGCSFVMDVKGEIVNQCADFVEDSLLAPSSIHKEVATGPASLYHALMRSVRDYVEKNGIKGILIGLSGGIDSAISAAIAVDALGSDRVTCVMMPSAYTSQDSLDDAADCAKSLGVSYDIVPIAPLVDAFMLLRPDTVGLAHENLQSRLRGLILMTRSNETGWMVLSTGNKSEMATGYATLYGDMCGGYNALKDVYKTQVYEIARWRNTAKPVDALGPDGPVINERTLTKAPTAELKPGQRDQDTLPPYDVLDQILHGLIEDDLGVADLSAKGFDRETVAKVAKMLDFAEYKRRQAAPGPRVSTRALTRERRYPIVNGFKQLSN